MDRVFLDANVLFSAAYAAKAGLQRLWACQDVTLLTSAYAIAEARRNLARPAQKARLTRLMRSVTVVPDPPDQPLPTGVDLPAKDRPILLAASEAKATHLVTGDAKHFGKYFGTEVLGVRVLTPAMYLESRETTKGESGRP